MKLGTNDIGSVYLGSNAVQKVYLGTNEVWTSFTGLLDDYPNAAAAYSLRKLRSAYTGSAIRVRRASDNTEQDIGFINNELDTSTLTSFCSGTNGFVKTWYDQSGNGNDATQTTAASQPKIVSSGSVLLLNNKATINFASQFLNFTGYGSSNFSLFTTLQRITISRFGAYIGNSGAGFNGFKLASLSDKHVFLPYSGNSESLTNGRANVNASLTTQNIENWILPNAPATIRVNNIDQVTDLFVSSGWGGGYTKLGSLDYTGAAGGEYNIQEMIIYTTDETSNRSGINTKINDFYSIY